MAVNRQTELSNTWCTSPLFLCQADTGHALLDDKAVSLDSGVILPDEGFHLCRLLAVLVLLLGVQLQEVDEI